MCRVRTWPQRLRFPRMAQIMSFGTRENDHRREQHPELSHLSPWTLNHMSGVLVQSFSGLNTKSLLCTPSPFVWVLFISQLEGGPPEHTQPAPIPPHPQPPNHPWPPPIPLGLHPAKQSGYRRPGASLFHLLKGTLNQITANTHTSLYIVVIISPPRCACPVSLPLTSQSLNYLSCLRVGQRPIIWVTCCGHQPSLEPSSL